ncbi:glyoxalase [Polymorphobacter multimanifer]|uniref:VOC family protein n=1 Tax=Polymorphobacter multimanifer TaxID=1070431 RepID=UPI001669A236|nr:VOC family protein [Polymorphobacter multimanifer]GGI81021.1 glyoxalase [Polymorphobacter multimanifer]
MIGYVTLGTNDLERATAFYDALLAPLGASRVMPMPQGGFVWGRDWSSPMLAVAPPDDGERATAGNGNMVALQVESRDAIDALHAHAVQLGGSCEGPPGLRGPEGEQAFYGAYFRDPDGNKLCAFRMGPA